MGELPVMSIILLVVLIVLIVIVLLVVVVVVSRGEKEGMGFCGVIFTGEVAL